MKKLLALILSAIMCLAVLASCGSEKSEDITGKWKCECRYSDFLKNSDEMIGEGVDPKVTAYFIFNGDGTYSESFDIDTDEMDDYIFAYLKKNSPEKTDEEIRETMERVGFTGERMVESFKHNIEQQLKDHTITYKAENGTISILTDGEKSDEMKYEFADGHLVLNFGEDNQNFKSGKIEFTRAD